ncbi:MAG: hypothetical protein LBU34_14615 [Planctomycetaceae bacterium]|nr:hypothetical protein [Planctomycetaceae bacterium]
MMIKQNVQKQIVELFPQLPASTQIELALNFVSHAIIDFPDEYYNPQKLYELICNYVQRQSLFSEVFEEYEKVRWVKCYHSYSGYYYNKSRVTENDPIYIQKKYGLLFGLFNLCCHEGLKEFYYKTKGIFWSKPSWNVSDISWNAAFVKALGIVGDD